MNDLSKPAQPSYEVVASGLRFPEGPISLRDGTYLVVEIERGCLTRISGSGAADPVAFLGGSPNGAAIGPDGQCYVCNSGGFEWHRDAEGLRPLHQANDYSGGRIERVDLATGAVEVLYSASDRGPLRGPNDLVFDRQGGFWFTDTGKNRLRDMDRGGVYYATADGRSITEVIHPMLSPNGIGLSPAEDRLYVAETVTGRLWTFDIVAPGRIERRPWPSVNGGSLVVGLPGFQLFDSLAVERDGSICAATLFNGGISVVSSDGSRVEHVALPDRFVTNICFGGPDLRTAFVTLGQTGKLVSLAWPRPGLKLNFSDVA
ncbi:MAG: SMP-30/gluconolactonase/LRE family protein [Burkholderiales bacterium]